MILDGGEVDAYNGKAVRASAGSLFHLPIVKLRGRNIRRDRQRAPEPG